MDANEILRRDINMLELSTEEDSLQEKKRERLSAIIAGGGSKQYLGKDLQLSDIDSMTTEQISKLYHRYEARLGAGMTKTLGKSFIKLYVMFVSKYFKVFEKEKLLHDLEEDPFINHALTSVCCEMYYKYGMYLAPFTALLTTVKNINFDTYELSDSNSYKLSDSYEDKQSEELD